MVKTKLARANSLLLIAILVVNTYVVAAPFVPGILFWLQRRHSLVFVRLENKVNAPAAQRVPAQNRLLVPAMLLDQPVNEGRDLHAARNGPWRLPHTSTPDKGGNTVIIAHRFTYTNPRGAFYHLDKLQPGNEIGVYWNSQKYIYQVTAVRTVAATQISVEAPTSQPQLTLYTCTPLWLPKDRLVVTAALKEPLP